MRIFCVLRSGGDYRPEHVFRLQRQLAAHGETDFACLSDVFLEGVETIPLRWDWPGWWAKMELFRPDLRGDFLFLDLDMTVRGPLADFGASGALALMRDVYRPGGLQSSIMFLPERDRPTIWNDWIRSPAHWMRRYPGGGDQAFLERHWLRRAKRLQDLTPGAIVSYKADVAGRGVPENARVICFHGRPRPWEVEGI
jgi:hypothetical protein